MIDTSVLWVAVQSTPLAVDFFSTSLLSSITLILLTVLALFFLVGGFILWLRVSRARAANTRIADDSVLLRRRSINLLNIVIPALLGISLIAVFLALPSPPPPIILGPTPTPTPIVAPPNDLFAAGVLTVGSDTSYPPQEYLDANNNNPAGFDIDLITAMAKKMGLQVNVITTGFTDLLPNLKKQKLDVVISGMAMTPDNLKSATFIPYLKSGESLLVPNGNPKKIMKLSDLCGLTVGVQSAGGGNTAQLQKDVQNADSACKTANKLSINVLNATDANGVVQLLVQKKVDATYQDSPITDYYIKQFTGQFVIGGPVTEIVTEGIAVRLGDDSMQNAMMKAFKAVQKDGIYENLLKKWGFTSEPL